MLSFKKLILVAVWLVQSCYCANSTENSAQDVSAQIESIDDSRHKIEERINRRHAFLEDNLKTVSLINATYHHMRVNDLEKSFGVVQGIWQNLVKRSFSSISSQFLQEDLPNVKAESLLLNKDKNQLATLTKRLDRFEGWLDEQLELDQNLYNRVLLLSGKVRSKLYQELITRKITPIRKFSDDYFSNFVDEIQVIPTRWAATIVCKVYDWKRNLTQGWRGMRSILSEVLVLAVICYFVFFIARRFQSLSEALEQWISNKLDPWVSSKHKYARFVLYLFYRSIPWMLIIIVANISRELINLTTVEELSELIDLVIYYFYYRLFLTLITYGTTRMRVDNIIKFSYEFYKHLLKSVRHLSLSFLIYFMFLKAVDSVVGKALVYETIGSLFLIVMIFLIGWEIYIWRKSIASAYDKLVSQSMVFKKLPFDGDRWHYILPYIQLSLLICGWILSVFTSLISGTQFGAKISSQIFVRRAKMVSKRAQEQGSQELLTADVLDKILDPGSERLFSIDTPEIEQIYSRILDWDMEKASIPSLCLVGERGSGGSTIIDQVSNRCTHLKQILIAPKQKHTSLDSLFIELAQTNASHAKDLKLILTGKIKIQEKTLLIIDNMHNLFLSQPGGFDLLEKIFSFMSQYQDRIFTLASFNSQAFNYLARSKSFIPVGLHVLKIEPWIQTLIKGIIQFRAEQSNVNYSFEDLGLALGIDDDLSVVENRYYQVLSIRSMGIPRLALLYWGRSLYRNPDDDLYMVGLPYDIPQGRLRRLLYHHWSTLALIIRHQKLSMANLITLNPGSAIEIRYGVQELYDFDLLELDRDGFYQIESTFYWDCLLNLRRLNLIND